MRGIHSVIDLGYGDSGKGLTVDYLCSKYKPENTFVIRHSGGHQVGHTVRIGDVIHEFHHFGSGTLRGFSTIWLKECTVSPTHFRQEHDILGEKGVIPKIYFDPFCPVTTPYDVAYNRAKSFSAGKKDTVGVGFAATLIRHKLLPLFVMDLYYPAVLAQKLANIKNYYENLTSTLSVYNEFLSRYEQEMNGFSFREDCDFLIKNCQTGIPHKLKTHNLIFEGNQGIMLDKLHGFYPYVTYGHTTNKNVIDFLKKEEYLEDGFLKCWYVTRAYSTRHGDGTLLNSDIKFEIKNNEDESNHTNNNQGPFRTAPLNLDLLEYAICCDHEYVKEVSHNKNIVVTCVDQVDIDNVPFIVNGNLHTENILKKIWFNLGTRNVYLSKSSETKELIEL